MNSQEMEIAVLRKVLTEQVSSRIQCEVETALSFERCRLLQNELEALKAKYEKPADPTALDSVA